METEIKPVISFTKEENDGKNIVIYYTITCPGLVPEPKPFKSSFTIESSEIKDLNINEKDELIKNKLELLFKEWTIDDFNDEWKGQIKP